MTEPTTLLSDMPRAPREAPDGGIAAAARLPSFGSFAAQARGDGFDEVLERRWPPGEVVPSHAHPFAVRALLVQGEMWLRVGDGEVRHLRPGDPFELARDVAHDERYGPEGATYWVARRAHRG